MNTKNFLSKFPNLFPILGCLVFFILIAFAYCTPLLKGDNLYQPDIIQYRGGAEELLKHRAKNKEETYWSNAMFSGMPTYQTGAQFRGDIIKQVDNIFMSLPKPVGYLFLIFSGFFFLVLTLTKNWKYALLGAVFFGFSTYFYIIIAAGHNGKIHAIAYFAPLITGIILLYYQKKYILGFIVTALSMGLQISANHLQMTYYLFIALGFLFIFELIRTFLKKKSVREFSISTGITALALILGIGMNSQRILANSEYIKETVRGKQILSNDKQKQGKDGMDKESILAWSYGKTETLNLLIPRLMGGSSSEKGGEKTIEKIQQSLEENISSQEEYEQTMQKLSLGFSSPSYWGEQPGTSGPAYQGAVVIFLAILGFFFIPKKFKYWILGACALTIALAWGSNFMALSEFFIDFVPFYNKFRAPSSILVVAEILLPLVAILGLFYFFLENQKNKEEKFSLTQSRNLTPKQKEFFLLTVSGGFLGILVIFYLFGEGIFGFITENERKYLPDYIKNILKTDRANAFKTDVLKTFFYILITAGMLLLYLKKKIKQNWVLLILGMMSILDLWSVNKRYFNDENFVDKIFAKNPFQTEINELLIEKTKENPNLQAMLAQSEVNQTLQKITENDQKHYRIFNQTLGTFNETNTSFFKSSIGGYHAVKLRRYDDLINEYFFSNKPERQQQIPEILNMLNTKYIVGGNLQKPEVQINPLSNGNAWFVSEIEFVKTPNQEIDKIGRTITKRKAIISEEFKDYFKNKKLSKDTTAQIQLTRYSADEIHLKSQSKTPQLAVFSEIYYPYGWKFFIDGKEMPYIRANYLLRAIHLPQGAHEIKMIFKPEVIEKGKWISIFSFAGFIFISIFGIFANRKKKFSF